MSNQFVKDYASCAETLLLGGDHHPTMQDIASAYCNHSPAPPMLVRDVWDRLPAIKTELEKRGYKVTLVSRDHYQATTLPVVQDDAFEHLPIGRRKAYGIYFASASNDIILTAAVHKGLIKAAGFVRGAGQRVIDGRLGGQIPAPEATAMVQQFDNDARPRTNPQALDRIRRGRIVGPK